MAIHATNYDGSKDYDLAELSDLRPKQHIINPDFQVWQRGEHFLGNNNIKAFADMWKFWGKTSTSGVDIVKEDTGKGTGITWFGSVGSIIYILPKEEFETLNGKTVTIVYAVNKGEPKIINKIVNDKKVLDTNFGLNVGDVLNYVNLWEGDIAYPHVKNKYEYDLEECKKYILNLNDGESYTISIKTTGSSTKFVVWNRFATSPNLVDNGIEYFNNNLSWVSGTMSTLDYHRNYVDININTPDANDGGVLIRNLPILSCEPL